MSKPLIKSGRFHAGSDLQCGENVVIDVAEEVVVGDRVTLPDNAYFSGRRVTLGDDFHGYSWGHPAPAYVNARTPGTPYNVGGDLLPVGRWLEVGRGRRDDEDAILTVGNRCTFHDNRIDLARHVTICDDVGLSPEVVIYTHGYWQSVLEGFPAKFEPVVIGDSVIIGFRSVLLPGADVGRKSVIGAGSVVAGKLEPWGVYGGVPAKRLRDIVAPAHCTDLMHQLMTEYNRTREYRGLPRLPFRISLPSLCTAGVELNVEQGSCAGEEDADSDDLRWFLFTRGVRIYTKRPFRKLGRKE